MSGWADFGISEARRGELLREAEEWRLVRELRLDARPREPGRASRGRLAQGVRLAGRLYRAVLSAFGG
jgi:hypothetical protein